MKQQTDHIDEMTSAPSTWLSKPQRYLHTPGLIALLLVSGLITPLSTDMYTPAVPSMPVYFSTTAAMINATLLVYFVFFALAMLFFGPVSDRYGRKPLYVMGIATYTLGSLFCAVAPTVYLLIAARIVQGIGAGAVSSVSTALVKDCFKQKYREKILIIIQLLFVVGPVIAPLVGAILLQFGTWRLTFVTLTVIGAICTVGTLFFEESLPVEERLKVSVFQSLKRLGVVAGNKGFLLLLLISSLFNLPFMAYVAVASYIYIDFFNLTQLQYSYFFAAVAGLSVFGPLIYLSLSRLVKLRTITSLLLGAGLLSGFLLFFAGHLSPFVFCFAFLLIALAQAAIRPFATNLLLVQQEGDTGSASSLINFMGTAMGCLGMFLTLFPWPNYIFALGVITTIGLVSAIGIWIYLRRSGIRIKGML